MKRNKARNIKFALATTLAFVFMIAMSVTSLASTTVSVVPTPYGTDTGGADLSVDLHLDTTGGFNVVWFFTQWDPAALQVVTNATPGGTDDHIVWGGATGLHTDFAAPHLVAQGRPPLQFSVPMADPPTVTTAAHTGVAGRLRFNIVDGAEGDVQILLAPREGRSMGVEDGRLVPIADPAVVDSMVFNTTNIRWGFYNASADAQAFIRYALDVVQDAAWVDFFYGQVVPAARAINPNATGADALVMLNEWIAIAA